MKAIKVFSNLILVLFMLLLLGRFFEAALLYSSVSLPKQSVFFLVKGIFYDFSLLCVSSLFLIIPFLILWNLKKTIAIEALRLNVLLIGIINFGLIFYFTQILVPLDHVILNYSWSDYQVISSWLEFDVFLFAMILIGVLLMFLLTKKITLSSKYFGIIVPLLGVVFLITPNAITPHGNSFKDPLQQYITTNKLSYFSYNIRNAVPSALKKALTPNEILKSQEIFQLMYPNKTFINKDYPLLHVNNTPDVLSPYFNLKKDPPNIVVIIMESLSRSFSGPNAYLGSLTPFLDSLANHSLYFENFLSLGERTFCVLQNTLGSLPYGKKGLQSLSPNFPRHNSIISLLKKENYSSVFFYSDDAHFGKMDDFMIFQGIDDIIDRKDLTQYNEDLTFLGNSNDEFSFGQVSDEDLFKSALGYLNQHSRTPYIHVYLTLSMHYPFHVPDEELYTKKLISRIKALNKVQQEKILKHKIAMRTAVFVDDVLETFFDNYKSRPEFNNTIFIITGDHKLGAMPHKSKIDVYHVPLLIYSPLLKKEKYIKAVNTHLDITPSLVAMLESNYNITVPNNIHWLGESFNLSEDFIANKTAVCMLNNRNTEDALFNNYYISNNVVYKLNDGMNLTKINNPKLLDSLNLNLNSANIINQYVCYANKITPNNSTKLKFLKDDFWDFEKKENQLSNELHSSIFYRGEKSAIIKEDEEFCVLLDYQVKEISNKQCEIYFYFKCDEKLEKWPIVTLSLKDDNKNKITWKKYLLNENYYLLPAEKKGWYKFMISIPLNNEHLIRNTSIKASIWNKGFSTFYIDDVSVLLTSVYD